MQVTGFLMCLAVLLSSPDVRAFLQMDNPKHQSDPSEDEDERSNQKVIKQRHRTVS